MKHLKLLIILIICFYLLYVIFQYHNLEYFAKDEKTRFLRKNYSRQWVPRKLGIANINGEYGPGFAYPYYNKPIYQNYSNHPYYNQNKFDQIYYPYDISVFND